MAYRRAPISTLTLNYRGLNAPERRTHLLKELMKKHISVTMLQETHFREGVAPSLRNKSYPNNHFCNHPSARTSGVAILLAADLAFTELDKHQDAHGRYLFLKGIIADKIYTFATIYVPNRHQATFLKGTLTKLRDFAEGTLLMERDFNAPLDPTLDSSSGHSCIPQRNIRSIRNSLNSLGLVDCWRALNPTALNSMTQKPYDEYHNIRDEIVEADLLYLICYPAPGYLMWCLAMVAERCGKQSAVARVPEVGYE
ncbi:Hypothetical predicted protein [Pelobates cultripes]|uniref:exodeoxyribonuclease III n=1 Tax=Pelobates cultripes TaxID=61616 RepID=A0AAD1S1S1_PELCU|nr:Hypothetical predicted protein [Pelobates cultripes]